MEVVSEIGIDNGYSSLIVSCICCGKQHRVDTVRQEAMILWESWWAVPTLRIFKPFPRQKLSTMSGLFGSVIVAAGKIRGVPLKRAA